MVNATRANREAKRSASTRSRRPAARSTHRAKSSSTSATGRVSSAQTNGKSEQPALTPDMESFLKLMETAEKAGINSVRKLRYFIEFANNEGKSMAELAGRAKTQKYNEIQQAVIELSVGRYNALVAPNLVHLGSQRTAKPGSGRRKPIRLTAKGRRLYRKIGEYCERQG